MFVKVTSLLALVAAVVAQSTINTPASVVQCQPVQISWTATNTPVFISIIPGGQAGAAALQDFGQQTGSSLTWTANIPAGTSITFQLRDSTGAVAFSSPVTIQASSDSSCLGAQASTTAAGSSSAPAATSAASSASEASSSAVASASSAVTSAIASASSAASTATSPATTSAATSRSSTASVISGSRSSTASSPAASSTASNAAMPTAKVGIAGLLGLAAAVVMA